MHKLWQECLDNTLHLPRYKSDINLYYQFVSEVMDVQPIQDVYI